MPRKIFGTLVFSIMILFCSAKVIAEIEPDDRMTLPFDLIQGKSTVFQGVDYALLNTANAFLASPFSTNYMASSAKSSSPRWLSGFEFEEIESIRELTEKSSFAARASYKSPTFKVAASINKQRETDIKETSLRQYAFTRYETRITRINYDPKLSSGAFRSDVVDMRRDLDSALARQDFAGAAAIRSRFRSAYGTGFIRSVTEGGMFFLQNTTNFSSKAERDQFRLTVSGSGGGSSAGANKENERRQVLTNRFKNVRGKFVGGGYQIADATWDQFLKIAAKWAESVEKKTEPLSAEYVPYYRIEFLRPLTSEPSLKPSPNTAILGYYGTPDRPNSGIIVSLQGEQAGIQFGVVPMLLPVAAYVVDTKLKLLVTVDPDLVRSPQVDLVSKWADLKTKQVGQLGKEIKAVVEPPYLENAFVWPTLRVSIVPGSDPTILHPVRNPVEIPVQTLVIDQNAASANNRPETQMNGWYEFEFKNIGKPVRELIERKQVSLSTNLTMDFLDLLESDPRIMEIGNSDKGNRISFRYPGVPLISEQVRFTNNVEEAIRIRIKAALEGPVRKVVKIPANPKKAIFTRSYWAGGGAHADHRCATVAKDGYQYPLKDNAPADMELVGTRVVQMPGAAGGCQPAGHCDSAGESCRSEYNMDNGCYINKDWYDWFMATVNRYNLGSLATPSFMCGF